MKRHLQIRFQTDYYHLFAWRLILRTNISINRWFIFLYRYQMRAIGEPSHRLMDLIADLEGDVIRWEMELRYL